MDPPRLEPAEQRRRHHLGPPLVGDGITVEQLGLAYAMPPGLVERRHGNTAWLFMLFHDPAEVVAKDGLLLRPPNSLAVWAPGQAHCYGHRRQGWCHSWLHACGPLVDVVGRRLGADRVLHLPDPAAALRRFTALSDQVLADPDPALTGFAAAALLRVLVRQLATDTPPPPPPWLAAVRTSLDEDYRRPLRMTVLARRAGRSATYLCAAFRACYGLPPKAYLVGRRLDAAAWMLQRDGATVAAVAEACGFADVPHFTRLFRRRFSQPPGAWRVGRRG